MSKSVNVILNSRNSVSGNTQQENYFIDWRTILNPNKKYFLHFVYMGGANTYNGSKFPVLSVNFQTNNYISSFNSTSQSGVLGILMPTIIQGASNLVYFQSLDNTNLPIYLENMPANNNLTVFINDNEGNPYLDNAGVPAVPAEYVLILKFSEVDEDNI
jgi:hypothetical protein